VRVLTAIALTLGLPTHGTFVPGQSLGGIRLGMTAAQVRHVWGSAYGVCRGCPRTTWYFTYAPFDPHGAGVELERGRVVAVFTLWSPRGWQTPQNALALGNDAARVTLVEGPLPSVACRNYAALVRRTRRAVSGFYLVEGKLWGFGLTRPGVPVCR
jgi:hypothetical protein